MRRGGAALLATLLLAGCGGAAGSLRAGGGPGAGAVAQLQVANGPVAAPPERVPLQVRIDDPHDALPLRFHHPPRSGLLFDLDTGRVLWRLQPQRVLPIASLTKMMTALVVVANQPPDAKVLITPEALSYRGSGVGVLPRGKRVKLETLLNGLLLPSGNDAARALAQHTGGTIRAFVSMMNRRAAQMGLRCTHYTSPDGFVDAGNHSCAVDLAAEAKAMLDQPRLARIVRRRHAILPLPIKGGRVFLYNNNPLMFMRYPGVIGVKTGFTDAAGHCLVAAAQRGHVRLGVVLLRSPDTGDQARKLLDRGFRVERG